MGEKLNEIKNFLFENVLALGAEYGTEYVKQELVTRAGNEMVKMGANVMLDYGATAIPGIGGAITSFRTNRKIRNLAKMVEEINKQSVELTEKFKRQSEKNKEILDNIFEMIVSLVETTNQQEKIEYMIYGYSELLDIQNPSFDVAYLYYDALDKLTLLDIDVLKLMYKIRTMTIDGYEASDTYQEILDKFGIEHSQYEAVRANLLRLGLLEDDFDNKIEKDNANIENAIDDIRVTVESLQIIAEGKKSRPKLKKLTSKSKVKLKSKSKLVISKFGREFVDFFLFENNQRPKDL